MRFITLENLKTLMKNISTSKTNVINIQANVKSRIFEISDEVFSCFVKVNCSELKESTTLSVGCSNDRGFISQLGGSANETPHLNYHLTSSDGKCYFCITSDTDAKIEVRVSESSSFNAVRFVKVDIDNGIDLRTFKPSPYGNAGAAWEI